MKRIAIAFLCCQALASVVASSAGAQGYKPSAVACDHLARSYAEQASRQGQVLGGAAAGGLVGWGIGALAKSTGVGAAVGLGVGVIGGGAKRRQTAQRMYNAAYQDCMAGRIR